MQDEFLPSRKWWSAHVRRRLRAHLHVVFLSNRIIAPCSTPDFVVPPPSPFSSCLSCTCLLTSCKIVHWSSFLHPVSHLSYYYIYRLLCRGGSAKPPSLSSPPGGMPDGENIAQAVHYVRPQ